MARGLVQYEMLFHDKKQKILNGVFKNIDVESQLISPRFLLTCLDSLLGKKKKTNKQSCYIILFLILERLGETL